MADRLRRALLRIEGVEQSASQFGDDDDPAWWVNGKEIAHFDDDGSFDLRLTRAVIRAHRQRLREDARVELRGGDWLRLRFHATSDLPFVLELCELAAAAHRAKKGSAPVPPPTGAALERRRRFH